MTPDKNKAAVPDNEPEITDEPDDVQEQSPELFEDFLDKNDEAMEEQSDDAAEEER